MHLLKAIEEFNQGVFALEEAVNDLPDTKRAGAAMKIALDHFHKVGEDLGLLGHVVHRAPNDD